jgi:alginate O-acetyltransferase complex protein AlgI
VFFNSSGFLVYFLIVVAGYYAIRSHQWRNAWLLAASLFFYGCWDWRFLGLLCLTILIDFNVAKRIQVLRDGGAPIGHQRAWLAASIVVNLGALAFFKYYNFFEDNVNGVAHALHVPTSLPALHVALVVGISFFTFQSMSYTIDVFRGHIRAADRLSDFALFVSFFPHLVAGPIMRAVDLLPQILIPRHTTQAQVEDGIQLIVWGFWKKLFVADNLAPMVNELFSRPLNNGFDVLMASYGFAFQIYGDFSGYTDIARGLAKLLGFELTLNFNLPYLAASPQEFWTRWHISLSNWLREYLYIPLGGSRGGEFATYRNLLLTMVIGGLWHGAAWNFLLWGMYQGLGLVVHRLYARAARNVPVRPSPAARATLNGIAIFAMFQFTCYGWLLFRAESLPQIVRMTQALFTFPWTFDAHAVLTLATYAGPLILIEGVIIATRKGIVPRLTMLIPEIRIVAYSVLSYCSIFAAAKTQSFIYFRF